MNKLKGVGIGLFAAIVVGVVGVGLFFMWVFGVGFLSRSTAHYRGGTQATEIVQNGRNQLAQYDYFFNTCAGIQGLEDKARIYANDETAHNAALARRADLIREYNARAAAIGTSGQFRAAKLPRVIDPNQEETQCAA